MKRYFRLAMTVCAVLCALAVASCSSDDDGFSEEDYPERIVGLWQERGVIDAVIQYRFNADGTGEMIEDGYSESFDYTLSGSSLVLRYGPHLLWPFEILKMSGSELIMRDMEDEEDRETFALRRIE